MTPEEVKRAVASVELNGLGPGATVIGCASNLLAIAVDVGADQELIVALHQHGDALVRVNGYVVEVVDDL